MSLALKKAHPSPTCPNGLLTPLKRSHHQAQILSIVTMPTEVNTNEEFIIFQAFTAHETDIACKHGIKDKQDNIILLSPTHLRPRPSNRGVYSKSCPSRTIQEDHIRAALSKYGPIKSAHPSFNAKATMISATVNYKSAQSIAELKVHNSTYVQVRDDIATVTWLGNEPICHEI